MNNQIKTYSAKVAHASFQAGRRPARKLVKIKEMIYKIVLTKYLDQLLGSITVDSNWNS